MPPKPSPEHRRAPRSPPPRWGAHSPVSYPICTYQQALNQLGPRSRAQYRYLDESARERIQRMFNMGYVSNVSVAIRHELALTHPWTALSMDGPLSDEEQRERILRMWRRNPEYAHFSESELRLFYYDKFGFI